MIKVTANKTSKLFNLINIKKLQYSTQTSYKYCNLISQSYLKLEGVDQISFLQGMTTNHIKNWFEKEEDKIIYTGILSPQGRVLFDAFLYRQQDDSLILETHKDNLSPLRSHLLKYRLLSQVDIEDATDSFTTLFSFGSHPLDLGEKGIAAKDPRVLGFGIRYLINKNKEQGMDNQSEIDYILERYRLGIPEGPTEIRTNQALPMESNMELMNGVHFSKGCYIGQELTTRTKHRGVIRKRIVPITYDPRISSELIPQDLYASGSKRSVGKLLSTLNGRGLALVKLTNVGDTLTTKSDNGNNIEFKSEVPNWWPSSIMESVEAQQ